MKPPRFLCRATEVATLTFAMTAGLGGAAYAGQIYTHSALTLHGGPGDGFAVTDQVDSGTQIDVLWCSAGSSWCLVQHDTGQGWAPLNSLRSGDGGESSGRSGGGSHSTGGDPAAAAVRSANFAARGAAESAHNALGNALGSSSHESSGQGRDGGGGSSGRGNNGGGSDGNGRGGDSDDSGGHSLSVSASLGGGGIGASISTPVGSVKIGVH